MSKEEDNGIVLNARIAEYDDERALNVALAAGVSGDAKIRYITITAVKKKVKIHKTKEKGATSTFGLGKSWGLDDIESIEPFKGNAVCIHLGSKAYYWILDSPHNKIELMHTMVTLSQTHLNKIPKLIKIDEELLKDQMAISLVSKNSSSSASQTAKTSVEQKKQPVPLTIPNATSAPTATQESAKFSHIASNIPESNFQLHVSTTVAHTPTDNDLEAFLEKEISNQEKRNIKEQQSFNLNELLGGFNWQVNGDAADLEKKLESELQALEAANVHAIIESEESAEKVLNQIQSTLNELKTIDEWLFHYTTLLDRMGQDVHSVEVRNKVLQVTTANQKSLLNEVDKIVTSMKLSEPVSQRLKYESLDEISGIKSCERAIQVLTETIGRVKKDEDIADIVMVKERIGLYDSYSTQFGERLTEFLKQLFANLVETLAKEKQPRTSKILLKISGLDNSQRKLCQYRPLMKWLKSIDTRKHKDLEMHYIDAFGRFYKKEIREYIDSMKTIHCKRKTTTEDLDYIFSAPQVSVSSAATTALSTMSSNMIERGKGGWNMLGGTAAAAIGSRKKGIVEEDFEKSEVVVVKGASVSEDSKIWPDEAIIEIYKSLCPIIVCELNFVMDFFNIRKNLSEDTADSEISHDWIDSLKTPREKLKDMKPQKTLNEFYDEIFDVHDDICNFMDWSLKHDQTYSIRMMIHVEDCLQKYNSSAYINFLLQMELFMTRVVLHFDRFIDEQIKSIEETKVTFRKRNGIIPFIRTFPKFVDRMERCVGNNQGLARSNVTNAYSRLVKAIFDTVEALALAKDLSEGSGGGSGSSKEAKTTTVDDKDSLHVHILTIENMHHFHSEIRARKISSLEPFLKASKVAYDFNMEAYIKIVIRKPLGKLLEFFETVENLLKSNTPEEVSFHLHKITLRDTLKKYPGKEIKKALETLFKRVDKHFNSDEDGSLLQVVWRGIQEAVTKNLKRYEELIALCYPDTGLRVEFTITDLLGYFSDLAQKH